MHLNSMFNLCKQAPLATKCTGEKLQPIQVNVILCRVIRKHSKLIMNAVNKIYNLVSVHIKKLKVNFTKKKRERDRQNL